MLLRNMGCLDEDCNLCAENPKRRCDCNFAPKYLAGDILKAKCGASIRVEVIDCLTKKPVTGQHVADVMLEVSNSQYIP